MPKKQYPIIQKRAYNPGKNRYTWWWKFNCPQFTRRSIQYLLWIGSAIWWRSCTQWGQCLTGITFGKTDTTIVGI